MRASSWLVRDCEKQPAIPPRGIRLVSDTFTAYTFTRLSNPP